MKRHVAKLSVAVAIAVSLCGTARATNCSSFPYPNSLTNGTTADGSQVMGNFSAILNCANTVLAPLSNPSFSGAASIQTTSATDALTLNLSGASGSANLRAFVYAYFGSDYSAWSTIIGSNVRAREGTNSGMELATNYLASGASAIRLNYNYIEFDVASASDISGYSAGTPFSFPRVTITSSGDVGIGTVTPDMTLTVNGNADKASGGTAWSVFSDVRLKDVQSAYSRGLNDIVKLDPVLFHYKKNNPLLLPSKDVEVGVVAQQARAAFPETVTVSKSGYLEFNMSAVQFAMINAFKDVKAREDHAAEVMHTLITENEELRARDDRQARLIIQLIARVERVERRQSLRVAATDQAK